jgi:hypothetical protein
MTCCKFVYSVIKLTWNKQYVFFILVHSDFYGFPLPDHVSYLIFLIKFWIVPFGAITISLLINPRPLAPKWFEHFTWSAPPLFILDLLLWIGSAYYFLYINSCLIFNKLLTNLTLSRQHHLQYTCIIHNLRSE